MTNADPGPVTGLVPGSSRSPTPPFRYAVSEVRGVWVRSRWAELEWTSLQSLGVAGGNLGDVPPEDCPSCCWMAIG